MFDFKYPFLYLLSALVAGILCSASVPLPFPFLFFAIGIAVFCCKRYGLLADIALLSAIFCVGWLIAVRPSFPFEQNRLYLLHCRCEEKLSKNNYILSVHHRRLYLSHFYADDLYRIGDSLSFTAYLSPVRTDGDFGESGFARYLKQKEVFAQVLPRGGIRKIGHVRTLRAVFSHLQEKLLDKTECIAKDSLFRQLMDALCLGYRNDLDPDLRDLFVSTGTIHLLSVSGLHAGAVYLLLTLLFKALGMRGRKVILSGIPFLWVYTCLTGLSPSAVRASTILTFISFGKAFHRTYTPVNSLAAAAFFTLLFHPPVLYSLSFLLSYSAYSGILLLYPFFIRPVRKSSSLLSKVYAFCCLSLAAQIPTIPIAAFYFHSVNVNGFLANLIAIPLTSLFLYSSVFCLLFPASIGRFLAVIPRFLSRLLFGFLKIFSPYSLNIKDLYPSQETIILVYACLLTLGGYFLFRKRWYLYGHFLCLVSLLVCLTVNNLRCAGQSGIVVFQDRRNSHILLNYKGYCIPLIHSDDSFRVTQPYIRQNRLKSLPYRYGFLTPLLCWRSPYFYWKEDTTILVVCRPLPDYADADVLIVTGDILPQQLVVRKCPELVVADGSNRKYTIQEWRKFCENHRIAFRSTEESGSVCLTLK